MRQWKISNSVSGVVLGVYDGAGEGDALEAFARDAGYRSYKAACEVAPVTAGELVVRQVEELEVEQ